MSDRTIERTIYGRELPVLERSRGHGEEDGVPASMINCADSDVWATARCAELRAQGIAASPIMFRHGGSVYHVAVRMPDGSIEYAPGTWPDVEHVLCAAIWVDTGKAEPPRRSYAYPATGLLFCALRHGDCFTTLHAWADRLTAEERVAIGEEQIAGRHQGFLTSRGRYVDREEAMTIARAAGQTSSTKSGLFSEDLY